MLNQIKGVLALSGLALALMSCAEIEAGDDRPSRNSGSEADFAVSAPTSLSAAVRAAEAQTGARAVSADIEELSDGFVYEVVSLGDGKAVKSTVDPATGSVTGAETLGLLDWLKEGEFESGFGKQWQGGVSLLDAVATAEDTAEGNAAGAEMDDEDGRPAIEVEIVRLDRAEIEVTVSGATGEVLGITEQK